MSTALLSQNFASIGTSTLKAQRWVGWIFIYKEEMELSNEDGDEATNYWPNTKIKAGFNWLFRRDESMLLRNSTIDDVFTRVLNYHYSPVTIFYVHSISRSSFLVWANQIVFHVISSFSTFGFGFQMALDVRLSTSMYLEDAKRIGIGTSVVSEIDKRISWHFASSCSWYKLRIKRPRVDLDIAETWENTIANEV